MDYWQWLFIAQREQSVSNIHNSIYCGINVESTQITVIYWDSYDLCRPTASVWFYFNLLHQLSAAAIYHLQRLYQMCSINSGPSKDRWKHTKLNFTSLFKTKITRAGWESEILSDVLSHIYPEQNFSIILIYFPVKYYGRFLSSSLKLLRSHLSIFQHALWHTRLYSRAIGKTS